jgi:hypothetical protein
MFNPFGKDFRHVTQADLEVLRSVAEGWYVEYKGERPNGKKIAKSVSSFANSHGGLYFIGIESDRSTKCATAFNGVADSPDVVRDSVRGNLQPFPYFDTLTIDVGDGRRVLMVVIPEGRNAPYVHSDGRIYRREEAASDLIAENNRYTIDELYRRAEGFREELEKFREFDLTFSRGEGEIPYVELFVNCDPFHHFVMEDFFTDDNLKLLMNQFNSDYSIKEETPGGGVSSSGNIKLDSMNTYHDSIALRNLEGQNLAYNGLTLIVDVFGNLKLLVPLSQKYYSLDDMTKLPQHYLNMLFAGQHDRILERLRETSISDIGFLDGRQIAGAIIGVMSNYVTYLDGKHYEERFEAKMRLRNCWRKSLNINSETFSAHVGKFGIPICMKSEQYFPVPPIAFTIEELKTKPVSSLLFIFAEIANALGVPAEVALASVIDEIRKNPQTPLP